MKNKYVISKICVGIFVMVLSTVTLSAQNYKAAFIDASGKVTDNKGYYLGWVTAEGTVKDTSGSEIAHVDDKGNLVNAKTGEVLGKAEKNGTFVFHFNNKTKEWVASPPMNGICEVKNHAGKTVLLVHENYKNYGACAYHCLTMKKAHKEMKMK
jgi:hypothetical protein